MDMYKYEFSDFPKWGKVRKNGNGMDPVTENKEELVAPLNFPFQFFLFYSLSLYKIKFIVDGIDIELEIFCKPSI